MTRGFSLYLDWVRASAALVVVLVHLAYDRFTGGELAALRAWDYGRDAVMLFFVLSGLVIAFAAERDGNASRFAFNRLTRLLSVLVPALVLTWVLDGTGRAVDPTAYKGWWFSDLPLLTFLARGLTATNEWFYTPVRIGTNGPLWSLSYEVAYYLLFGIAVFMRGGWRLLLLLLITLLAGPRVLILMPAWLAGVWAWRTIKQNPAWLTRRRALLCALVFPLFYFIAVTSNLPEGLSALSQRAAAPLSLHALLGFSADFAWNLPMAGLFALHLVAMARLLGDRTPVRLGSAIRWMAGASFTIYVLHYPLMQALQAVLPLDLPVRGLLLLGLTLLGTLLVAEVTERRLGELRRRMRSVWIVVQCAWPRPREGSRQHRSLG